MLFDGYKRSEQLAPPYPGMHALKASNIHFVVSGFEVAITLR